MAKVKLPKNIDPVQMAIHNHILKGDLPLERMGRLAELLYEKEGLVTIYLKFGQDAEGYATITGTINAKLKVICQRCDTPMLLPIEIAVKVSPIFSDEQAKRLPKKYDPLMLSDETISLSSMIEEEILLGFPIVPKHPIEECLVKENLLSNWEEKAKDHPSPFAVLKKLLRG